MDATDLPMEMASITSLVFIFIMSAQHMLTVEESGSDEEDAINMDNFPVAVDSSALLDAEGVSRAALQHWRVWHSFTMLDDDLGYWVKPRSTTWFSIFLLEEYDNSHWIQMFRMTKKVVFSLSSLLAPCIQRSDTKFRQAIPVVIRVGCTLFKLCHGSSLLVCSELFAIGRNSVSILLPEVVEAMNIALRSQVSWPTIEELPIIARGFQRLCGLPAVLGAIDGTHFAIRKPRNGSADYFYFKSGAFSINCQAVVDSSKHFLDLYVGMPGSTHDARMLRRSALFHRGQHRRMWPDTPTIHGFRPYLIGDAGYPLLPWLMVPYHGQRILSVPQTLFNRRLSRGRAVVENAFALLKQCFRELNQKSELHVTFFPDVVAACVLLHNVLRQDSHEEVEGVLEGLQRGALQECQGQGQAVPNHADNGSTDGADGVRRQNELGVFLMLQKTTTY